MSCTNNNSTLETSFENDPSEMLKRITKYLIEGVIVAIVARWISSHKLTLQEIATIALTASATFILLDVYSPSVSAGYRQGVGLILGIKTMVPV
jgi:hypothetical protein